MDIIFHRQNGWWSKFLVWPSQICDVCSNLADSILDPPDRTPSSHYTSLFELYFYVKIHVECKKAKIITRVTFYLPSTEKLYVRQFWINFKKGLSKEVIVWVRMPKSATGIFR